VPPPLLCLHSHSNFLSYHSPAKYFHGSLWLSGQSPIFPRLAQVALLSTSLLSSHIICSPLSLTLILTYGIAVQNCLYLLLPAVAHGVPLPTMCLLSLCTWFAWLPPTHPFRVHSDITSSRSVSDAHSLNQPLLCTLGTLCTALGCCSYQVILY
jgi:hypothetical protein